MIWEQVGDYGMRCGEFRVGKFSVYGKWIYVLSFGWKRIMQADNFKSCADEVKRINK